MLQIVCDDIQLLLPSGGGTPTVRGFSLFPSQRFYTDSKCPQNNGVESDYFLSFRDLVDTSIDLIRKCQRSRICIYLKPFIFKITRSYF